MDPRFRRAPKKTTKVVVDERFQAMFDEDEFVQPVRVDKYGRRVESNREQQDLWRFYHLEEEDKKATGPRGGLKAETDTKSESKFDAATRRKSVQGEEESWDGPSTDSESDSNSNSNSDLVSGSDSDSELDSESPTEETGDYAMDDALSTHPLVVRDIPEGEATRRLAVVNLDWDQIRAEDIFTLLHAFKPLTGAIQSVTIYPSRFGRERMEREALEGPPRELFQGPPAKASGEDDNDDDEEEEEEEEVGPREEDAEDYDTVALRRYQLERLRYYYAVVECDSVETAMHVYRHCDGSEFEKSANFLDLRFIPEHVTFSPEQDGTPRDVCVALPKSYKPKPDLVTSALQQSRVALTWDADDAERVRVTRRPRDVNVQEADLAAYLASATDSDDEERDAGRYRALLLGGDGADEAARVFGNKGKRSDDFGKAEDLQITFASALAPPVDDDVHMEATFDAEAFREGLPVNDDDGLLDAHDKTQFAKYLERRKAKKLARKEAAKQTKLQSSEPSRSQRTKKRIAEASATKDRSLSLLLDGKEGEEPSDDDHRDVARRVRRAAKRRDAESLVDVHDPRFAAVYEEPAFALDPSHPSFKRTAAMDQMIKERQKRRLR